MQSMGGQSLLSDVAKSCDLGGLLIKGKAGYFGFYKFSIISGAKAAGIALCQKLREI
jgi:hypothetical protein